MVEKTVGRILRDPISDRPYGLALVEKYKRQLGRADVMRDTLILAA